MSLFSELMADVGTPAILETLGGDVTRYPEGNTGAGATVTATWAEDEPGQADNRRGIDNVRMGTLKVATSQTVSLKDRWLVNAETWEATSLSVIGGLKTLRLKRVENELRAGEPITLI